MEEKRREIRYPTRLKAVVVNEHSSGKNLYHGIVHDISTSGLSIVYDHNVHFSHLVIVLFSLPVTRRIIEVECRYVYTVHSSKHLNFRSGLTFTNFKRDGRRALMSWLEEQHYYGK